MTIQVTILIWFYMKFGGAIETRSSRSSHPSRPVSKQKEKEEAKTIHEVVVATPSPESLPSPPPPPVSSVVPSPEQQQQIEELVYLDSRSWTTVFIDNGWGVESVPSVITYGFVLITLFLLVLLIVQIVYQFVGELHIFVLSLSMFSMMTLIGSWLFASNFSSIVRTVVAQDRAENEKYSALFTLLIPRYTFVFTLVLLIQFSWFGYCGTISSYSLFCAGITPHAVDPDHFGVPVILLDLIMTTFALFVFLQGDYALKFETIVSPKETSASRRRRLRTRSPEQLVDPSETAFTIQIPPPGTCGDPDDNSPAPPSPTTNKRAQADLEKEIATNSTKTPLSVVPEYAEAKSPITVLTHVVPPPPPPLSSSSATTTSSTPSSKKKLKKPTATAASTPSTNNHSPRSRLAHAIGSALGRSSRSNGESAGYLSLSMSAPVPVLNNGSGGVLPAPSDADHEEEDQDPSRRPTTISNASISVHSQSSQGSDG